jgi:hypothetical protein
MEMEKWVDGPWMTTSWEFEYMNDINVHKYIYIYDCIVLQGILVGVNRVHLFIHFHTNLEHAPHPSMALLSCHQLLRHPLL